MSPNRPPRTTRASLALVGGSNGIGTVPDRLAAAVGHRRGGRGILVGGTEAARRGDTRSFPMSWRNAAQRNCSVSSSLRPSSTATSSVSARTRFGVTAGSSIVRVERGREGQDRLEVHGAVRVAGFLEVGGRAPGVPGVQGHGEPRWRPVWEHEQQAEQHRERQEASGEVIGDHQDRQRRHEDEPVPGQGFDGAARGRHEATQGDAGGDRGSDRHREDEAAQHQVHDGAARPPLPAR